MTLRALSVFLLATLVSATAAPAGDPPYPPSSVITGIEWDSTHIQDAHGSDGWTITWGDDGNLYTAYADGWGFDYPPDCPREGSKLSTGYCLIEGFPDDYVACNIDSADEPRGDGNSGKKARGLLSLEGVLYMLLSNADNDGHGCEIWESTDKGLNWTDAGWDWMELGACAFLNFGRDYEWARDDYVYMYTPNIDASRIEADDIVLARVPGDQIMTLSAWDYFSGMDGGEPTWSSDIADRESIFHFPKGCNRLDVTYSFPLRRYLLVMRARDRLNQGNPNHFSVYDAPEPWGPWTTVFYTEAALPDSDMSAMNQSRGGWGEHDHIPSKWISSDGTRFFLVYSGDDKFTLRGATLTVNPVCTLDSECDDGVLCNGAETCGGWGYCQVGGTACDDGDPCTADSCDEISGCGNLGPDLPLEAEHFLVGKDGGDPAVALLSWDPLAGADSYNLYRGGEPELSDLGCFLSGLSVPGAPDDGALPAPGTALFYLATGVNCSGESPPGTDSSGGMRSLASTCF